MKLREVDRTATVAWSPSPHHLPLIAAGTVAGALDSSFSTSTELEIYDLNMTATDSRQLKKIGGISGNARFNRLAWGMSPDQSKKYGILAGGTESGELDLWDPKAIIEKSPETLLMKNNSHKGPVRGLDFNPVDVKFLASGATDGEVFIWDLTNPTKPYSPGARSMKLEDITTLSWSRHHFYILATASNNGNTVLWDLRNRRELPSLSHPGGRRTITGVAWNPDNPMQIATASDDDMNPVVYLWDLRMNRAPEKTLVGHTRGILSIAWCSKDSDLLVSCGKDNRTVLWNPSSGEVVGDLEISNNWSFDAQWCNRNPDLVCVASFDGKVSVHSLQASSDDSHSTPAPAVSLNDPYSFDAALAQSNSDHKFTLKQPPKWLKRPVGCSWGFGGRLIHFNNAKGPDGQVRRSITMKPVMSEPSFAARALELDRVKDEHNPESFMAFCQKMASAEGVVLTEKDREIWKFLRVMFETGAREQLLKFLGFDKSDIGGPRLADLLKKLRIEDEKAPEEESHEANGTAEGDSADVFASVVANAKQVEPPTPFKLYSSAKGEQADTDALIMKALILGDFDTAVRVCFGANRLSDALMFAVCGGPDLLAFAQTEYFKRVSSEKPYARVLKSVIGGDLRDVVENAQLEGSTDWKDLLALICTYAKTEDLSELMSLLGRRLEASISAAAGAAALKTMDWKAREDRKFAAVFCYLGAGDLSKVVSVWSAKEAEEEKLLMSVSRNANGQKLSPYTSHVLALQSMIEKVQIFRQAIGYVDSEVSLAADPNVPFKLETLYNHYVDYAECVANQGLVDVAWKVLELVPEGFQSSKRATPSGDDGVSILKDRVYHGSLARLDPAKAPKFPFKPEDVMPLAQAAPVADYSNNGYYNQSQTGYGQTGAVNGTYDSYYGKTTSAATTGYQYGNTGYGTQTNQWSDPNQGYGYNTSAYNNAPPMMANQRSATGYAQTTPAPPPTNTWNAASVAPPPTTSYPAASSFQPPPPIAAKSASYTGSAAYGAATSYGAPQGSTFSGPPPPTAMGGYAGQQSGYGAVAPPDSQRSYSAIPPAAARTPSVNGPSPQAAAPAAPARPPFGDRSRIPAAQKPLIESLDGLLAKVKETKINPQQKKEFEDTERKVFTFVDQLNNSEVSAEVVEKVNQFVKAVQARNFSLVHKIRNELVTSHMRETSAWIFGLKRIADAIEDQERLLHQPPPQPQQQQMPPPPTGMRPPPQGGTASGYMGPPPQSQAPPQQRPPPPSMSAPPTQGYGAPPPTATGYARPPPPSTTTGYGVPPPATNAYGAPPPSNTYGGVAPPPTGNTYGAPPPSNTAYGAPPQTGYGAPPQARVPPPPMNNMPYR
ncbi:protein transport protein S31 [Chytridiales sp. JEL 0842]|nr:protein transport protein S31 [Chytridiales sp. JEL 0842]